MARPRIRARRLGDVTPPEPVSDPSILEVYLEDASGSGPGRAAGLLRLESEAEAAAYLRRTCDPAVKILPQAGRSSLTGGAVPQGEVVISVERMAEVGSVQRGAGGARVAAGPGTRLRDLQKAVGSRGFYYPPVPTYQEAMLSGTVSTNAGGAATFKYGVTRQWVHALRVLLFNGDLLEIERGQASAGSGEEFLVELSDGRELHVPVPRYTLPALKKVSAGYHAADPFDLVDLFIGSEGTLGLITGVTVDLVSLPGALVTGLVFQEGLEQGLALSAAMRSAALEARRSGDPAGPDIRAIEFMDARSLDLMRRHGDRSRFRIRIPPEARVALLFEMELPERTSNDEAQAVLARFQEGDGNVGDIPLVRLFKILEAHSAMDHLELAFPEDEDRAKALCEFRGAVPERVNEILAGRRRQAPGIRKAGGDLIVPIEHLAEMIRIYEEGFSRRALSFAVWGHLSDGNLHPNALPGDARETALGQEAQLEFAEEAVRRGGCPLSEHGVGRNPVKQEILRRFLGDAAIASMRTIKKRLDPEFRFAPGVLFPPG